MYALVYSFCCIIKHLCTHIFQTSFPFHTGMLINTHTDTIPVLLLVNVNYLEIQQKEDRLQDICWHFVSPAGI